MELKQQLIRLGEQRPDLREHLRVVITSLEKSSENKMMEAMDRMHNALEDIELTGDIETDFATMMIPHHQSAVEMAEAYLEQGGEDEQLVELAEDIIEAQEKEIEFLENWLKENL